MKRSFPLTLLLIVLTSATAFANHLYLSPNGGSGDNFAYVTQMNGHQLVLSGGTDPYFLSAFGYQPGSTLGGGALYLYSSAIWIDGIPTEFAFPGAGSISMYPLITLPTDGRDFFRALVDISFSHTGINYDTGQTIDVGGGALGSISFSREADGLYYASSFAQAQVPEPGTLGLIGTGLMGILAVARKRLGTR
ncbi:MAG: PEP-CTERM sorting domain-containing protein [Terriglobales bacterium]